LHKPIIEGLFSSKKKQQVMEEIKIVIADDHDMFRLGMASLLKSIPEFKIIGSTRNGEGVIDLLSKNSVDVLLLDVEMPDINGVVACEQVVKTYSDVSILALSWHREKKYVVDMVKSGAQGYMIKDAPIDELISAIKAVAQGGSYFSKEVSATLLNQLNGSGNSNKESNAPKTSPLTDRELEILEFISNEFTNKEIASQLFISPRTVETHRRNLIQKLKVKNTVGLVRYYFQFVQTLTNE